MSLVRLGKLSSARLWLTVPVRYYAVRSDAAQRCHQCRIANTISSRLLRWAARWWNDHFGHCKGLFGMDYGKSDGRHMRGPHESADKRTMTSAAAVDVL